MKALLRKTDNLVDKPLWGVILKAVISDKYVVRDREYPMDCVFDDNDTIEDAAEMFNVDLSDYELVKFSITRI